MQIGVPKEVMGHEYRVGMTPDSVRVCTQRGHAVFVEQGAGLGSHYSDEDYQAAGATIAAGARALYESSQLIVKVKEPQRAECEFMRPDHILFGYLHLAAKPDIANALKASGCTAIAYETVVGDNNELPMLAPMSVIAGRLASQFGAHCLTKHAQGRGVLCGGVEGVDPANVLVIGGGNVGRHAAEVAAGLGANVTIIDISEARVAELERYFFGRVNAQHASKGFIEQHLPTMDLVVGAVLIPGRSAPRILTRDHLSIMRSRAVLVDVAIDQGGCFETSRVTTHAEPTFICDDIVHYGVANMPGSVPRTATMALNHVTLPGVLALADLGVEAATQTPILAEGVNIQGGQIVHPDVAMDLEPANAPEEEAVAVA